MKNALSHIADSILDDSIAEYRDVNLANSDSITQYALEALNLRINDNDALKILEVCKKWLREVKEGKASADSYYHNVIAILNDLTD